MLFKSSRYEHYDAQAEGVLILRYSVFKRRKKRRMEARKKQQENTKEALVKKYERRGNVARKGGREKEKDISPIGECEPRGKSSPTHPIRRPPSSAPRNRVYIVYEISQFVKLPCRRWIRTTSTVCITTIVRIASPQFYGAH